MYMYYSRQKVETFQCSYDVTQDIWSADFAGHYHAIFTNNGYHFPGVSMTPYDFENTKKNI